MQFILVEVRAVLRFLVGDLFDFLEIPMFINARLP